jgi:hypothetical protein
MKLDGIKSLKKYCEILRGFNVKYRVFYMTGIMVHKNIITSFFQNLYLKKIRLPS